jgi:predicted hotdog family 3-hydroxylacyl-ACP dehydratase
MSALSSGTNKGILTGLPSIAALLPHRPPMILLDEAIAWDGACLTAAVTIRRSSLFCETDGVPGYVGIEYMAQTCAAFAGAEALAAGKPVRIGYLLGTRAYRIDQPWFRIGDRLTILVAPIYRDEAMGNFDCSIEIASKPVAQAQLTVYHPPLALHADD